MMRFKVRLHKPLIHMHTPLIRTKAFTLMVMDMSWVRDDSFLFGRAFMMWHVVIGHEDWRK